MIFRSGLELANLLKSKNGAARQTDRAAPKTTPIFLANLRFWQLLTEIGSFIPFYTGLHPENREKAYRPANIFKIPISSR